MLAKWILPLSESSMWVVCVGSDSMKKLCEIWPPHIVAITPSFRSSSSSSSWVGRGRSTATNKDSPFIKISWHFFCVLWLFRGNIQNWLLSQLWLLLPLCVCVVLLCPLLETEPKLRLWGARVWDGLEKWAKWAATHYNIQELVGTNTGTHTHRHYNNICEAGGISDLTFLLFFLL